MNDFLGRTPEQLTQDARTMLAGASWVKVSREPIGNHTAPYRWCVTFRRHDETVTAIYGLSMEEAYYVAHAVDLIDAMRRALEQPPAPQPVAEGNRGYAERTERLSIYTRLLDVMNPDRKGWTVGENNVRHDVLAAISELAREDRP